MLTKKDIQRTIFPEEERRNDNMYDITFETKNDREAFNLFRSGNKYCICRRDGLEKQNRDKDSPLG